MNLKQTNKKSNWNMFLGIQGERVAQKYLCKKGFKILASRFHTRFGEIDLIAEKTGVLYFIEVKTRSRTDFGSPLDAITPRKIQRFKNAAKYFLLTAWAGKKIPPIQFLAAAVRPMGPKLSVELVSIFPD